MKIKLQTVNYKKIQKELNEFFEKDYKNQENYLSIIKDLNNKILIGYSTLNVFLMTLNAYDIALKEKLSLDFPPINGFIYKANSFNNQPLYESEFKYETEGENISVYLEIKSKLIKYDCTLQFLESQLLNFMDSLKEDKENLEESIKKYIILKVSDTFEKIQSLINMSDSDLKKIKIELTNKTLIETICYSLVDFKMKELLDSYKDTDENLQR